MSPLKEIVAYFLKLGFIGFGGPLALVAMMQQDLIIKRKWMELDEFISAISLIKVLPGTFAFQTAVFLGRRRAGALGGILAGVCLVLPAMFMMIALAIAYEQYGANPSFQSFTKGFEIGSIALVIYSIYQISRPYQKISFFYVAAITSFILLAVGVLPEPAIIILLGCVGLFRHWYRERVKNKNSLQEVVSIGLLIWIAFKSGAFVFGSGLAVAPLLEGDFVHQHNLVDLSTFMTALAFGQMTPGPILVTITFLGYRLAGFGGAIISTFFIFLPSALHMLTWFPHFFKKVSTSQGFRDFSIGAIGGVIGAIALFVGKMVLNFPRAAGPLLILIACLIIIVKWRIPSWIIVVGSGVVYFCTRFAPA